MDCPDHRGVSGDRDRNAKHRSGRNPVFGPQLGLLRPDAVRAGVYVRRTVLGELPGVAVVLVRPDHSGVAVECDRIAEPVKILTEISVRQLGLLRPGIASAGEHVGGAGVTICPLVIACLGRSDHDSVPRERDCGPKRVAVRPICGCQLRLLRPDSARTGEYVGRTGAVPLLVVAAYPDHNRVSRDRDRAAEQVIVLRVRGCQLRLLLPATARTDEHICSTSICPLLVVSPRSDHSGVAVDRYVCAEQRLGLSIRSQYLLKGCRGVVHSERRVVHCLNGDCHGRRRRGELAVRRSVGEAVLAAVPRIRRVGERAVRRKPHCAVRGIVRKHRGEPLAHRIAVIAEHAGCGNGQRRVLPGHERQPTDVRRTGARSLVVVPVRTDHCRVAVKRDRYAVAVLVRPVGSRQLGLLGPGGA